MKKVYCSLMVLLALSLSACSTVQTTSSGRVGVDRKQTVWNHVSEKELQTKASLAYAEIVTDAKNTRRLNPNSAEARRVKLIANKLIKQVGVFREDALNWKWEVNVLDSKEINAWCMPGGKIAVYTGIIRKLDLSDSELAAIIGHEISHALREHSRERASGDTTASIGQTVLGIFAGKEVAQIGGAVAKVGFLLPNSREHEREADAMGVELAARAGYDPRAAITLWEKMEAQSSGGTIELLSTHPSSQSRQKDLAVMADKVMDLYEDSRPKAKTRRVR